MLLFFWDGDMKLQHIDVCFVGKRAKLSRTWTVKNSFWPPAKHLFQAQTRHSTRVWCVVCVPKCCWRVAHDSWPQTFHRSDSSSWGKQIDNQTQFRLQLKCDFRNKKRWTISHRKYRMMIVLISLTIAPLAKTIYNFSYIHSHSLSLNSQCIASRINARGRWKHQRQARGLRKFEFFLEIIKCRHSIFSM